jgi:hypothetical protein
MFYFEHTWWTYHCFTSSIADEHTNVLLRAYLMNISMFCFERTWWLVCSSGMPEVKHWYAHQVTSIIPDEPINVLLRAYLMNIPMFYFEHTWWTYQCFTLSIPDEHTNVLLRAYLMNIPMFYFDIVMFIRYAPSKTLVCSSGTLEVKHWYVHQVCSK